MHKCADRYSHAHTCTHKCTYIEAHVHIQVYNANRHAHTHMRTHAQTYTPAPVHTQAHTSACRHTHTQSTRAHWPQAKSSLGIWGIPEGGLCLVGPSLLTPCPRKLGATTYVAVRGHHNSHSCFPLPWLGDPTALPRKDTVSWR